MISRKERAAEYIKEAYTTIKNGTVVDVSHESDDGEEGTVTELYISSNDKRVEIQICRGSMKRWY